VLIATVLNVRLSWLFSKDYPNATDGFYYLQELKYRAQHGRGYYDNFSIFFGFWSLAASLTGLATIQMYNFIFLSGLFLFCLSLIVYLRNRTPYWVIFSLIYIFLASDLLFYRQYAFLKQGFAVSLIFFGLAVYNNAGTDKERMIRRITGLVLILFGSLMHVYAAAIALVFLIFLIGRQIEAKGLYAIVLILVSGFIAYYLYFNPKEIFEINRLSNAGWWGSCKILDCSRYEWFEFQVYTLSVWFFLTVLVFSGRLLDCRLFLAALVFYIILNLPVWTIRGDMMHRLSFAAIWVLYIGFADILVKQYKFINAYMAIWLFAVVCCFNLSVKKPYNASKIPFHILEENSAILKQWIPEDGFILAEHGYQFPLTYFLDRRSSANMPRNEQIKSYYQLRSNTQIGTSLTCPNPDALLHDNQARCVALDSNWILLKLSGF
jgi:hypothetical protein